MIRQRSLPVFCMLLIFVSSIEVFAETVRVMTTGRTLVTLMKEKRAEVEKFVGAEIVLVPQPGAIGINSVDDGFVDAMTNGNSFEGTLKEGEVARKKKLSPVDFQWAILSKASVKMGLHPDNSVKEVSRQQITDILAGKITDWEKISGQKLPVKVVIANQYAATEREVVNYYLNGAPPVGVERVGNMDGLLKAMKANKGSLAFFTQEESLADFRPKYFPTGVEFSTVIVAKKNARPAVQKLIEYFKKTVPQ